MCDGDFNELLRDEENYGGGLRPQYLMENFIELVDDCKIKELRVERIVCLRGVKSVGGALYLRD